MTKAQTMKFPAWFNKIIPVAPLFSPKIGLIRRIVEVALKKIWAIDATERERALLFNDYLKDLWMSVGSSYGNVLDVGAREGDFAYFAEKYWTFPDTKVKSIDKEENFVQKWKKKWIDIETMDALSLSFPDASFNTLISHASMPHILFVDKFIAEKQIEDPKGEEKVIQWIHESLRVLKAWGEIRFRSPNSEEGDYRWDVIKKAIDKLSPKFFTYTTLPESNEPSRHWKTTYILKKISTDLDE